MTSRTLVALLALLAPALALAHGGVHPDPAPARSKGPLPHHDHTSLHGGLVLMSGDDHAELVAESGGVYRLWFTDAWRNPISNDVAATLAVETADGKKEMVAMRMVGPDGMLVGRGTPRDGQERKVHLDGKVGKLPFRTYWVVDERARAAVGVVEMEVTDAGFSPSVVKVQAGKPVHLRVTRRTDATCAKDLVVPGLAPRVPLPLGQPVDVVFTPTKTGELRYGCSMDQMVGGMLLVN